VIAVVIWVAQGQVAAMRGRRRRAPRIRRPAAENGAAQPFGFQRRALPSGRASASGQRFAGHGHDPHQIWFWANLCRSKIRFGL
jgi:hypothetical protein